MIFMVISAPAATMSTPPNFSAICRPSLPFDSRRHGFVLGEGSGVLVLESEELVKKRGANNIKLVCLVGAPEGVKAVQEAHPDVDIYLAALDEKLNEIGYIVPGLGDAGDRIFGTK